MTRPSSADLLDARDSLLASARDERCLAHDCEYLKMSGASAHIELAEALERVAAWLVESQP